MKLQNRFKDEDKIRVWVDHQFCALCGLNQNCSLHHILGTESNSILNSIMLCYECHKKADGHNVSDLKFQAPLLQYTIRQILKSNYEMTENDIEFYKIHHKHYNYISERN